jgi:hypothetical protein
MLATLSADRLNANRGAIRRPGVEFDGIRIEYLVPWTNREIIQPASQDLILSHSVLAHVNDLESFYGALHAWLRPGGWTSHQIDFSAHGLAADWNGYWTYSDPVWRLILGKRPFLINRAPLSRHLALLREAGLDIALELTLRREDGVSRARLARRWRSMDDEDLHRAGAFIQAWRPGRLQFDSAR